MQPANSLLSQPRRKRCATHHYIAHNICLHQKVTKTNNFWPAATGSAPLCGTKPDIFKVILPAENIVIGNPMLGSLPGLNLQQSQEHKQGVSNFQGHSGKGKISEAANFTETLKRKHLAVQQAPASDGNEMVWLHHLHYTIWLRGMSSSCILISFYEYGFKSLSILFLIAAWTYYHFPSGPTSSVSDTK